MTTRTLLAVTFLYSWAPPVAATQDGEQTTIPIAFEANRGQLDEDILFHVRSSRVQLELTRSGLTYAPDDASGAAPLHLEFLGAKGDARVRGEELLPGRLHFLRGASERDFVRDVERYGRVRYEELYDGIDLVWNVAGGRLKYELHADAGSDPSAVRFAYTTPGSLAVDDEGRLLVDSPWGRLVEEAPVAFQLGAEGRREVACAYRLLGDGAFGFELDGVDPALPLVIDPFLDFSTFFGGNQYDAIYAVDTDALGAIYVAGKTRAQDFPATDGSTIEGFAFDAFAAKFTADGDLVYATFLGGTAVDEAWGIAVDGSGEAVVAGFTTGYLPFVPKGGAIQDQPMNGDDGFACKLNAAGDDLVWATYVGGNGTDKAWNVAVDAAGNAYVVGGTASFDFPLVNADQTTLAFDPSLYPVPSDVFLTKISDAGTAYVYSTYLGSSGFDQSYAVDVDDLGRAYVAGGCGADDIHPSMVGAADPIFSGSTIYGEGFVVRYAANDGSATLQREYATFIGGTTSLGEAEYPVAVTVGPDYSCYVSGLTSAPDFPGVAGSFDDTLDGTHDGFVSRIAPDGGSFLYSAYLGGPDGTDPGLSGVPLTMEYPWGIALDEGGCAWVTGFTPSGAFPRVEAGDVTYSGLVDAFVSAVSPDGSTLMFSTYLGSDVQDIAYDVAADGQGGIVVVGVTDYDYTFPIHDAYDPLHNSHGPDGFITKFRREPAEFIRGDANHDGLINIADPIAILNYVYGYTENSADVDLDAADVNDSGSVDIADGIYLLSHLNGSGPAPAAPFPACGVDPTPDSIGSFVTGCQ